MAESVIRLDNLRNPRRRVLIVPREHGAWGMLLVPLVTGTAVGLLGGGRASPVLLFAVAVLALFWLRTPLESWLGAGPVHIQTPQERKLVLTAILPLALAAALTLGTLFWQGRNGGLLWLGLVAAVAFIAQSLLKRIGRATRMAGQVVGALGLTLTAPAAYYLVTGRLDARAWALWLVNFLFAGDQIHFVWIRIRGARANDRSERLRVGWSFLLGQIFLVAILGLVCHLGLLPYFALISFVPVLFRGLAWFVKESRPLAVRRLGWTELAHAVAFAILLIAGLGIAK